MALLNKRDNSEEADERAAVRVHTANTKLTKSELNDFNAVAKARGVRGSELLRDFVLREIAAHKNPNSADPIFTEIIGLRFLLSNALRTIYCGEKGTQEAFDNVLKGVKQQKRKVAGELAEMYRTGRVD